MLDLSVHAAMGIALAACAGLRAFLPLLAVGVAGRFFDLPLSGSFEWLSSWPALTVFGVAVLAELLGDKVPVVDHFLDVAQTVVKPIAGAMVTASVVADWSPLSMTVAWIILGGSVAGLVHVTKAQLRVLSTAGTAGLGNPVLSVAEDAGAAAGSVGALVAPFVVLAIALVALAAAIVLALRWRRGRSAAWSRPAP